MIWKKPKHVVVLCSSCSGEMDVLSELPGRTETTKFQVLLCDHCGIKRTVELDIPAERRPLV